MNRQKLLYLSQGDHPDGLSRMYGVIQPLFRDQVRVDIASKCQDCLPLGPGVKTSNDLRCGNLIGESDEEHTAKAYEKSDEENVKVSFPQGDLSPKGTWRSSLMHNEDAGPEGHRENNALSQALVKTFRANKKTADKFVLQWRMFHKLGDDPDASCSCGCSCSCS
jgi:hypothetical protein